MIPPHDKFNDELDRLTTDVTGEGMELNGRQRVANGSNNDKDMNDLIDLARRLQHAPAVQVDATFAARLEQKMLRHASEQRRKQQRLSWWKRLVPQPLRAHPVSSLALACCLLLLLGMGTGTVATQVTNPDNPLYALKYWEENTWVSWFGSPVDRAELQLQFARERLNSLAALAAPGQATSYQQALEDLNHKMDLAVQAVNAVPAGSAHNHLVLEFSALEFEARVVLQGLLPKLSLTERLVTTDALGDVGASVPRVDSVQIDVPAQSPGQATITIDGENFKLGASLLVNGRQVQATGSLQHSIYTFLTNWTNSLRPQSVGIMNPDGSAAQTTSITLTNTSGVGSGNGNNNGNHNGNGNGNKNNKGDKNGNKNDNGNGNGNKNKNKNGNGNGNGNKNKNKNGNGNGNGNGNKNKNKNSNSQSHGNDNKNNNGNGNGNGHGKNELRPALIQRQMT